MRSFVTLLFLIAFETLWAQDYPAEFKRLYQEEKKTEVVPLLTKWENAKPDDPEMFIAWFNYYFNESRNEVIRMDTEPGGRDALQLLDTATHEPKGFIYGDVSYNDSLFQMAQVYINKGIEKNPNRLDMHFGRLYSLREGGKLEEHVEGILQVISLHEQDKSRWRWSNNEAIADAEAMFKGSIQDYNHALFNLEKEPYSEGIEKISRKMMELYPGDVENYSNIGVCRLIDKQYPDALAMFEKAREINARDAIVLSNIAYTYMQMGKKKEAIEYYKKVIKVGDADIAAFAKEQIETLQK